MGKTLSFVLTFLFGHVAREARQAACAPLSLLPGSTLMHSDVRWPAGFVTLWSGKVQRLVLNRPKVRKIASHLKILELPPLFCVRLYQQSRGQEDPVSPVISVNCSQPGECNSP